MSSSPHQPGRRIGSEPSEKESSSDGFRETLVSICIALVFAFSFRIFVVEAFVIPTGSMAPTLLGEHYAIQCPQCGYGYAVDLTDDDRSVDPRESRGEAVRGFDVVCPMCHNRQSISAGTRYSAGDRILVQKFAYAVQEPRRWDVIVFKNPEDPKISYIKRLIGLPGESLMVLEGNIYTKPGHDGGFEGFAVERKSDRPEVQRQLWQPVYHTQYTPMDGGKTAPMRDVNPWRSPWVPQTPGTGWSIQEPGSEGVPSRQIRWSGPDTGTVAFDFDAALITGPGLGPYNQIKRPRGPLQRYGVARDRIEEIRFGADVIPGDGPLELTISTTARVLPNPMAPASMLAVRFSRDGAVELTQTDYHPRAIDGPDAQAEDRSILPGEPSGQTRLGSGYVGPMKTGVRFKAELWYLDDEVIVWHEGKAVLRHRFDVPINTVLRRLPSSVYPDLRVTAAGSAVTLENVEVDRDLYYVESSTGATGVVYKDEAGNYWGEPLHIEHDQFFCMGDNSAFSHDGRTWNKLDPWVKARYLDKHQQQYGVVPRELIMGRAFFVYFPSPFALLPASDGTGTGPRVVPNFRDMRVIR